MVEYQVVTARYNPTGKKNEILHELSGWTTSKEEANNWKTKALKDCNYPDDVKVGFRKRTMTSFLGYDKLGKSV